jgi:hypothetical protein
MRNDDILGLSAVYRVSQLPPAKRSTTLRRVTGEAWITLSARRDRTDKHPLVKLVPADSGSQLMNRADRFVPDGQTGADRVFTTDDVDISATDRRQETTNDIW